MAKNLPSAYVCWAIGGLFGLHHFYLGRDDHAFITFATCGGYFSAGIIRDLWRLPEYIKDANNDHDYLVSLQSQMKQHAKPPSSIVRQSGLMILGNLFAYLVEYAVPTEILGDTLALSIKFVVVPFASAFGVWLVGNVGRHQGGLEKPLIAAYLAATPVLILQKVQIASFSTLASIIVFNRYCKEWRIKKSEPRSFAKRVMIICLAILVYSSLWLSGLYFNCSFQDPETEEPIKCRTALDNFLKSSAYTNMAEAILLLVEHARHRGISGLWQEIMEEFDMTGKNSALSVLELGEGATREEILAGYRRLSREYHPDRERDESKKLEKQEKFIQIQEAYRILKPRVEL